MGLFASVKPGGKGCHYFVESDLPHRDFHGFTFRGSNCLGTLYDELDTTNWANTVGVHRPHRRRSYSSRTFFMADWKIS